MMYGIFLSDAFNSKTLHVYVTRYILTCGSDGDVRIWDGIEDDDAISHRCGDKSFAIAIKVQFLQILNNFMKL